MHHSITDLPRKRHPPAKIETVSSADSLVRYGSMNDEKLNEVELTSIEVEDKHPGLMRRLSSRHLDADVKALPHKLLELLEDNQNTVHNVYVTAIGILGISLVLVLLHPATGYNPLPFSFLEPANWSFQLANFFLLISYVSPNVLFLRVTLCFGGLWFAIWAATFSAGVLGETLLWNSIFTLINLHHAIVLFYGRRPITFDSFREKVYVEMFEGVLSRSMYKVLASRSLVRTLIPGRSYALRGDSVSSLAILIEGRLRIMKTNKSFDHSEALETCPMLGIGGDSLYIEEFEFIDSPEWMLSQEHDQTKFVVDLIADCECTFLMWPKETLQELLTDNPDLVAPLQGVLGIDVSRKLINSSF